jgi:uncharacterized protein YqjF (DUF2071 family)
MGFAVNPFDFNAAILGQVEHRPWAMPDAPWIMTQTWNDLLFAHWPVDAKELRSRVPPEFELDLFDGEAWLGIVPFYMTNVAPRGLSWLPGVSEFAELNVRTYVRVADKTGVWFFSLDAGSALAVHAARMLLNLPYYRAAMNVTGNLNTIEYQCRRSRDPRVAFAATYEPRGEPFVPVEGSLEYFLTERYCLYQRDHRSVPYRLDIHHPPWRIQTAEAHLRTNTMTAAIPFALPDRKPLLHFAKRQDMVAWAPSRLR